MKKCIALFLSLYLVLLALPFSVLALPSDDIVILYENDAHCIIEGYAKLASMKAKMKESYAHVGVVSGGDFVQGNSLGVISRGAYVIELMNLVGYDAVTLGNHEFDYRLDRLNELVADMNTKPVCCNFQKNGESEPYYAPYSIVSYGSVDIAYIGITTPSTISSSSPTQFKDENGEFIYSFHSTDLYQVVQSYIDAAKAEGADYVIALSHIGYADDAVYGDLEDVETLIKNTDGFDVVLDAHSHSVIEGQKIVDKGGNDVLLSSAGTKFSHVGKLTISDGELKTELIKTGDWQETDPTVNARIAQIYQEYQALGERKIAEGTVDLIVQDEDGNRLVRKEETNLGDLCAEAYRYAVDAQIGYINGGSLRAAIAKGDVTFNDILSVLPFNNTVVLAEIEGRTLRDMMEMAVMLWPAEGGAFPHLSGLTFSVNTSIPSSVVLNEYEEFDHVAGQYRVYNMKVYNPETQAYEPLELDKTYTIGASNYYLLEQGSGMKMLEKVKILRNDGILDVEAMERYISEVLGGTVGDEYAKAQISITFTEGEILPEPEPEVGPPTADRTAIVLWIALATGSLLLLAALKTAVKKQKA